MNVQILDAAEEDLVEGYWFYEAQQPGLGAYFRDSIYADVQALEKTAGVHRVVYQDYHRALATRFPFALYLLDFGTDSVRTSDRRLPARSNMDQRTPGITSFRL